MLTNKKDEKRRGKVQLIDASGERFWQSMRKSLGRNRREITDSTREEVTEIYNQMLNGDSGWGEYFKIFDTEDFGYCEIRVERPLKLNFKFALERLELFKHDKSFLKLEPFEQKELLKALSYNVPVELFKNRDIFEKALKKALKNVDIKNSAPLKKVILSALTEKDDTAEACKDAKGNIEADSDLRNYELVRLKEDWQAYIAREVKPFVPDAWGDESYKDAIAEQISRPLLSNDCVATAFHNGEATL